MRWPQQSAITRRDGNLARTRKLSAWIAGGATTASLGLATALGYALPGHSYHSGSSSASHTGTSGGHAGAASSGRPSGGGGATQPPAPAAPVVTSGGS